MQLQSVQGGFAVSRMANFEAATLVRTAPWLTMLIFVWSIVSGFSGGKQHCMYFPLVETRLPNRSLRASTECLGCDHLLFCFNTTCVHGPNNGGQNQQVWVSFTLQYDGDHSKCRGSFDLSISLSRGFPLLVHQASFPSISDMLLPWCLFLLDHCAFLLDHCALTAVH